MTSNSLILVAKGELPADLILANARVVNVFSGEIEPGNVAICGTRIAGVGDYGKAQEIINLRLARFVGPILFLLVIPVIQRNSIPGVRHFENIGRRSYGLYLTHLIVLDTLFVVIAGLVPSVLQLPLILTPILLSLGLLIPITVMNYLSKTAFRKYYRYVFG